MAAWPLNIYELSRPPLRRERAINWESRGGGTEREREGERERKIEEAGILRPWPGMLAAKGDEE